MTLRKRYGVTVNAYFDGQGYESDIALSCDNSIDTQYLCPFAMSDIMPMKEGSRCCFKDGCECRKLVAKIEALKVAKRAIAAEIKELESQLD